MVDVALLILRAVVGGLLAGHGAQKLFGWFGGYGVAGTAGWLESLGLRPGRTWAITAGLSEFGGGLLMLLGFLNPLNTLGVYGAMAMATAKAHWGKPIWVSSGGAELPLMNMAVATALALAGPGRYSLDRLVGIRLPRWLLLPGLLGVALVTAVGLLGSEPAPEPVEAAAGGELQAGEESHPV